MNNLSNNDRELTISEIDRQDFVDNSIYQLVTDLNPTKKEIDWNIEMIANIRDEIGFWIVERLNLCREKEFYPFLEEV
jgi:hypothetical protein